MAEETQKPEETKGQEIAVKQESTPAVLTSPFEEMERFFDSFFPRSWMAPFRRDWPSLPEMRMPFEPKLPRVDIIDRDDELVLRAEVPGVDKKDLDISMTDNTVTIKGTTKHEKTVEKGDYYRAEITRGSFARTVALPADVDGAKTKATFNNGMLELVMPKVEKSKRRAIKVE